MALLRARGRQPSTVWAALKDEAGSRIEPRAEPLDLAPSPD